MSFHADHRTGAGQRGRKPVDVSYLVHGTTVATNTHHRGQDRRVRLAHHGGLSRHPRDRAADQARAVQHLFREAAPPGPAPSLPGSRRAARFRGEVLEPLDHDSVRAAARVFRREGSRRSPSASFIPTSTRPRAAAAEILGPELPGVHLSLSSEVCPEFREYFRASTTVVNAAITPIVSTYLEPGGSEARGSRHQRAALIMQSNGGIYTSEIAREKPVHIVESGPAAGVIVAAHVGLADRPPQRDLARHRRHHGQGGLDPEWRAAGSPTNSRWEPRPPAGATTPRRPAIRSRAGSSTWWKWAPAEAASAWVDSGGALRVGPRECGGRARTRRVTAGAGQAPTLTDANLILGRINPDYFLGGKMKLSRAAAGQAVENIWPASCA